MRTRLTLLWLALGLLLALAFALMVTRFVLPRNSPVRVAALADLTPGRPIPFALDDETNLWLVRLGDAVHAWAAMPPAPVGCAPLLWVGENNRFEDPCSGAKWCADGSLADIRFHDAPTLTGYATKVRAGAVYVWPLRPQPGALATPPLPVPGAVDWLPPDEVYYCENVKE